MISQRSRYAQSVIGRFLSRDGETVVQALTPAVPQDTEVKFSFYRWNDADRIDNVAAYFFEDETAWWVIANANPEILMWDEVPVGTVIRIPDV